MKTLLIFFVLLFSSSVFCKEDTYFCKTDKEYGSTINETFEPRPDDNLIFKFKINHETKKISFSDKFYYDNTNETNDYFHILSDQSFDINFQLDEDNMFRAYADMLGEIVFFENNVVITFAIPNLDKEDIENMGYIASAVLFAKCYVM